MCTECQTVWNGKFMWEYKCLDYWKFCRWMHTSFPLFSSRSHVSTVTSLLHSLGPNVSAAPTLRRSTALHRPANSASSSVPSTGRMREGERWPITCTLLFSLITHPHSGFVLLTACVWCDSLCSDRLLSGSDRLLFSDFSTLKAQSCLSLITEQVVQNCCC